MKDEPIAKIERSKVANFSLHQLVRQDKNQPRADLIVKYVDFSSKYGLGYKLSNGSYGVLFNDSTKIILDPNLFHFDYLQRTHSGMDDAIEAYDFFNYPKSINKKVILLQHFKSYLDGNQKFKPLEFGFKPENAPPRIGLGPG